jgi:hypothetical protein
VSTSPILTAFESALDDEYRAAPATVIANLDCFQGGLVPLDPPQRLADV